MLPISACSPGETGLRASNAGSKARLMLSGLGVEMEPRPQNPREDEQEVRTEHPAEKGQGFRPGDPEDGKKPSLYRLGKRE